MDLSKAACGFGSGDGRSSFGRQVRLSLFFCQKQMNTFAYCLGAFHSVLLAVFVKPAVCVSVKAYAELYVLGVFCFWSSHLSWHFAPHFLPRT